MGADAVPIGLSGFRLDHGCDSHRNENVYFFVCSLRFRGSIN